MIESIDFSAVYDILATYGCKQQAIISVLQDIWEHYRYLPHKQDSFS